LKEIEVLDRSTTASDFWDNNEFAQKLLQKRAGLQRSVTLWKDLHKAAEDISVMVALSEEEEDDSMIEEIQSSLLAIEEKTSRTEIKAMLSGENDFNNAIMMINSGAGGTESQDWAMILLRMYTRWGDIKGYRTEVVDIQYGEEAGIKSAMVIFTGDYAFGYLRSDSCRENRACSYFGEKIGPWPKHL